MTLFARGFYRDWRGLLLIAAVLVYACALQGVRPIYSPDEGRYTDVALGMLDSGDWVHPMLHHEVPHWSKPPLTYWVIAASIATFGRHAFAARLPGALAFAFTILLMVRLGRRFVPRQPWLPALVYASFVLPSFAANLVTTDSLLAVWEALEVVAFVDLWWATTPTAARRARWLLGLACGLAFLTKGPPGLLALAGCLAFAGWSEGWRGLRRALGWDMLFAFVVVGGSWYALICLQEPGLLRYFLVREVVDRVATNDMHRNGQWYGAIRVYLPTFVLGTLPWLFVLAAAAWRHRRDALTRIRNNAQLRLLACWLLLPLTVFVLARSRLPLYVVPLFAPLAVLVARQLAPWTCGPRWRCGLLAIWLVMLVLARAVPAWLDVANDDRRLAEAMHMQLAPLPHEIAFVDTAPRFGLRLYLGSEIERLVLAGERPTPQSQMLSSELEEHEGCRLLVARDNRVAVLESALDAAGVRYRRLNDARGYALLAEFSPDCAWRSGANGLLPSR
jgi:4-amino-4-deoxy-L-arabinose transferase-like glycosyltransferase